MVRFSCASPGEMHFSNAPICQDKQGVIGISSSREEPDRNAFEDMTGGNLASELSF